ncbi:MAG: hypothetical protein E7392_01855 [Ruminococcaceae bacterium]|nr:hypothetical protein [Oscillospiraceae bacterium]
MLKNFEMARMLRSSLEEVTNDKSKDNAETLEKKELTISGKEIHSLDEIRENFDAECILNALGDGSLLSFLKSHYYEREADVISRLSPDNDDCLKIICDTFGVEYLKQDAVLTAENLERIELLKKLKCDKEVINNFRKVALNQGELARLLTNGETIIYLCNGKFSIPLSKKGIRYIGINNPTIENPFTMQQYKNAGITVENIKLADKVSEEMSQYALNIAKENGYDDYADKNSPLAAYFHNRLKSYERFTYITLPCNYSEATKDFSSEYSAKQQLGKYLRQPYDTANEYVTVGSSKCLASAGAEEYADVIESCFEPVLYDLSMLCALRGKSRVYKEIENLVKGCREVFIKAFEKEINDNQDYYNMYDFDYFVDSVNIQEHDYRVSEGILRVIETIFTDSITYSYSNIIDTVCEMEKDINTRATSFFKSAYREYLSYVRRIEKAFEALGNDFPPFGENEPISEYLTRISVPDMN